MMFLEPELVIKRIAIIVGTVIVSLAAGATIWYNTNLKSIFEEGKNETLNLKEQTVKLGMETIDLKTSLVTTAKDIKNSLNSHSEETKKLDSELKVQNSNLKLNQQELEKFRVDVRMELQKLRELHNVTVDQLRIKEQSLLEQIKLRDINLEKYKAEKKVEIQNLSDNIANKDKEILDLRFKLDRELEWRNKNFWNRN